MKVQELFRRTPVILIGSGHSAGLGYATMPMLYQKVYEALPYSEIAELVAHFSEHQDFEAAMSLPSLSHEVKVRITKIIADSIEKWDLEIKRNSYERQNIDQLNGLCEMIRFFYESLPTHKHILNIVTSNYDTVVEQACDICGIEYNSGFSGNILQKFSTKKLYNTSLTLNGKTPLIRKMVNIYKPHGSINWIEKAGDVYIKDYHLFPTELPLIIAPGSSKYEESTSNFAFNDHREKANDAIRQADFYIIIGYGFNDSHLQTVLKQELRSNKPCIILTKIMSEKGKQIVMSINQNYLIIEDNLSGGCKISTTEGQDEIFEEPLWQLNHFTPIYTRP